MRAEEQDVDAESGIADSGEPLPNVPARPQAAETVGEAAEEATTTKYAEQAQALVEQEQARGIAPAPPAEAAVRAEGAPAEQHVAPEAVGNAVEQNVGGEPVAAAGATSEASRQAQQPIERQTGPAAAPAARVQEGATRVENVVGEPTETVAEQPGRREEGGEGVGAASIATQGAAVP